MKNCICCGAESNTVASTCANCGEGSWSESSIVVLQPKDEPSESSIVVGSKEPDAKPTVSESVSPPVVNDDSDTLVDVPRVRRGKRPN